jgi:hypothetical protein
VVDRSLSLLDAYHDFLGHLTPWIVADPEVPLHEEVDPTAPTAPSQPQTGLGQPKVPPNSVNCADPRSGVTVVCMHAPPRAGFVPTPILKCDMIMHCCIVSLAGTHTCCRAPPGPSQSPWWTLCPWGSTWTC